MNIIASKARLQVALLLVTVAGAVTFALAPDEGAAGAAVLAMGMALFIAEVGLCIADHFRSPR
jgi:hypothetical protein